MLLLVSVVAAAVVALAPAAQADAGLTVVKTANPTEGGTVEPGDTITYTIAISNTGDTTVNLELTDATPAGTTYVANSATGPNVPATTATNPFGPGFPLTELADTESHTLTFQVTVDSPADGRAITNTASVSADNDPLSPVEDDAAHSVSFLSVTKTAAPAPPTEVKPGDTITYTIVVENETTGTQTATNVQLTDATPDNTTYVADSATGTGVPPTTTTNPFETGYALPPMAPTDTHTFTFEVKVNTPLADGTEIKNTAEVVADDHPEVTADVVLTVDSVPGLKVSASAVPAPGTTVAAGSQITYTAVVSNDAAAADSARTVVYKDPTPEGTTYVDGSSTLDGAPVPDASNPFQTGYALGDIAPGISKTLSYKVTVNSGASAITRTVTVTAANAPASVTATTTHTGPGSGALAQPKRGGGGGGGGGTGASGAGSSVGSAGASDESGLAFTGLDTTPLVLLALTLLLAGWTLITRGRTIERQAVTFWDEARVRTSRLMSRDPSVGPWFFSAKRR